MRNKTEEDQLYIIKIITPKQYKLAICFESKTAPHSQLQHIA